MNSNKMVALSSIGSPRRNVPNRIVRLTLLTLSVTIPSLNHVCTASLPHATPTRLRGQRKLRNTNGTAINTSGLDSGAQLNQNESNLNRNSKLTQKLKPKLERTQSKFNTNLIQLNDNPNLMQLNQKLNQNRPNLHSAKTKEVCSKPAGKKVSATMNSQKQVTKSAGKSGKAQTIIQKARLTKSAGKKVSATINIQKEVTKSAVVKFKSEEVTVQSLTASRPRNSRKPPNNNSKRPHAKFGNTSSKPSVSNNGKPPANKTSKSPNSNTISPNNNSKPATNNAKPPAKLNIPKKLNSKPPRKRKPQSGPRTIGRERAEKLKSYFPLVELWEKRRRTPDLSFGQYNTLQKEGRRRNGERVS
jgi:hypothetical protein